LQRLWSPTRFQEGDGPASERGIDTIPDVCGGAAIIVRTRIPVWVAGPWEPPDGRWARRIC
jgi:hypothetical protein